MIDPSTPDDLVALTLECRVLPQHRHPLDATDEELVSRLADAIRRHAMAKLKVALDHTAVVIPRPAPA